MNKELETQRVQYLRMWAATLSNYTSQGLVPNKYFTIKAKYLAGPRVGSLMLDAGLNTGLLLSILAKNEGAILRQSVPWSYQGEPDAGMTGRYLRLDCPWPKGLEVTMVKLTDLPKSRGSGRWTVGLSEQGGSITAMLGDTAAHWLFGGRSGAGKSVSLRGAAVQLADGKNELVLCDAKGGDTLMAAKNLPGVVGPTAIDAENVTNALGWAYKRMLERYEQKAQGAKLTNKVIVFFDEFQNFRDNTLITGLLEKLTAMGRGAGCHVVLSTQHPSISLFGSEATRRNISGRLALSVTDVDASRVLIGDSWPRANKLLGKGDCYVICPGVAHRGQAAFTGETNLAQASVNDGWLVKEWAPFDPSELGNVDQPNDQTDNQPSAQQLAISILSAYHAEGRSKLEQRIKAAGIDLGQQATRRLLTLGRETWAILKESSEFERKDNA